MKLHIILLLIVFCTSVASCDDSDDTVADAANGADTTLDAIADATHETDATADMTEDLTADIPSDADDMPSDVAGDVPSDMAGDMPSDMAGDMPSDMAGDMPSDMAGDMPGDMAGDLPGDTDADMSAAVSCELYCAEVMTICTGADAQYSSEAQCLDFCGNVGVFAMGTEGQTSGNTVACRLAHARLAESSGQTATHCPHAGPTGAGVCGTWCDSYCNLSINICKGSDANYADAATCQTACAGIPTNGSIGDMGGDTVQCRIQHLNLALTNPTAHCPHASEEGGGVCVN